MVEKSQTLNTKNINQNEGSISSIVEAHIGKRLIASILDAFIAIFIFIFLSVIILTPIANAAFSYSSCQTLGLTYQTSSHLYVVEQTTESNKKVYIDVKDYTEKLQTDFYSQIVCLSKIDNLEPIYYLEHVHYYYTSFLTGENVVMPNNTSSKTYEMEKDNFVSPSYKKVDENGLLPKDIYTNKWFNEEILKINSEGKEFFEISDINEVAIIKTFEDNSKVIKFLQNAINSASGDLYYQDFYKDLNNKIKLIQLFIVLPAFVITMLLIYFLPTMLFKNGETLGKKFMHLAVISKNGYSAKKRQYVYRFLVFFVEITLFTFIVGIGFTSIATLGVGVLGLFIATLINKDHRSLHDILAMTLVVDANKSVWFNSFEDEKRSIDELNERMEKYKSVKIENKNIIQVGNKIVNEDYKKIVKNKKNKN